MCACVRVLVLVSLVIESLVLVSIGLVEKCTFTLIGNGWNRCDDGGNDGGDDDDDNDGHNPR